MVYVHESLLPLQSNEDCVWPLAHQFTAEQLISVFQLWAPHGRKDLEVLE